jgi:hypothetical protein
MPTLSPDPSIKLMANGSQLDGFPKLRTREKLREKRVRMLQAKVASPPSSRRT